MDFGDSIPGPPFPQAQGDAAPAPPLFLQGQGEDDWPPPAPSLFSGDFYREPDNVCRGLCLDAPDDLGAPAPFGFKGFADGDFYREPDDVSRGLSLDPTSFHGGFGSSSKMGLQSDFYDPTFADKEFGFIPPAGGQYHLPDLSSSDDKVDVKPFGKEWPPKAPSDSFFKLEVTTLYVPSCQMPSEIGNSILEYLQTTTFVLTKQTLHKYAIKIDIFEGGAMCSAKIRVYDQGSQNFAVEFQRRSGDSIAFSKFFQGAQTFVKKKFPTVFTEGSGPAAESAFNPSVQALPFADNLVERKEDLQPLLDMAGLIGGTSMQSEAACALHQIAEKGDPVLMDCDVFTAVGQLIQTSSTDVALPTSCLISHLAQRSEAAPFFAAKDGNLLFTMLDKISSSKTNTQVRKQLAESLNVALQNQTEATLQTGIRNQLMNSLAAQQPRCGVA